MSRRQISVEQYQAELRAQGVPDEHVCSVCPMCGTHQSLRDLLAVDTLTTNEAYTLWSFACIGRLTGQGPPTKAQKGKGCSWTLGGQLSFHQLEVINRAGEKLPRFELVTPEEAQAHMRGEPQP